MAISAAGRRTLIFMSVKVSTPTRAALAQPCESERLPADAVAAIRAALPDEAAQENRFEIGIPSLASIIIRRSPDGVVPGLKDFVAEDGTVLYPPVAPVFFSFRVMVGTGIAMLAVSWAGVWLLRRRGAAAMPRSSISATGCSSQRPTP